jgi:hypothetical protein
MLGTGFVAKCEAAIEKIINPQDQGNNKTDFSLRQAVGVAR